MTHPRQPSGWVNAHRRPAPLTRPGDRWAGTAAILGESGIGLRTGTDGRDVLINSPDGWVLSEPHLWWQGPAGGDGTGGPVSSMPPPGAGGLGSRMPAAVTRCIALIADTLAGMPWQVFRDHEKLPVPDWIADPQSRRVDQRITGGPVPEWRLSAFEFRASLATSVLASGTGEAMIYAPQRGADGQPVPPVWQVNPDQVGIDGGLWCIGAGGDGSDESGYTFQPGELIVIRGRARGGMRGQGVLQSHFHDLGLSGALHDYAQNMLREGIPAGYLKVHSPQATEAQLREVQRIWMSQHGGPRKKVAVLNATTDFTPLQLDPAAMQLAAMRDYQNLDWALIFGIPPWFLGVKTDSNTYANVTSRFIEFAEFGLLPWARAFESALDSEFPRGTNLKINLDSLRRADTLTRYQAHQIALGQGGGQAWMTVDEVRDLEDLPPLTAKQKRELGIDQQSQQLKLAPPPPPAAPANANGNAAPGQNGGSNGGGGGRPASTPAGTSGNGVTPRPVNTSAAGASQSR